MANTVSLHVNDDCRVPGLSQGRIVYAGMPNPAAFSLVHKLDVGPNYAHNLFYSVEAREVAIAGVQVQVESATPDMITIQARETRRTHHPYRA